MSRMAWPKKSEQTSKPRHGGVCSAVWGNLHAWLRLGTRGEVLMYLPRDYSPHSAMSMEINTDLNKKALDMHEKYAGLIQYILKQTLYDIKSCPIPTTTFVIMCLEQIYEKETGLTRPQFSLELDGYTPEFRHFAYTLLILGERFFGMDEVSSVAARLWSPKIVQGTA